MTPLRRTWFTPTTTCFLILWAGLLAFAPRCMLGDPGTLWHSVVGSRMLQTGELVRTDSFSFTRQGQPWVAQQWMAEIAMALLHRLGGLDALVLAAITLLAATYAWLFGRLLHAGVNWLVAAILIMLAVAASSYHFLPRPHVITIALTAWTFTLLIDVEAGRISPRRLLLLPLVYVLWTNLHGGVLGGIAISTFVVLAWLVTGNRAGKDALAPPATTGPCTPLQRRLGALPSLIPQAPRGVTPLLIGVVASLSFVAVLVNPYGPALPRVWIGLLGSPVLPRLIIEHAPLRLASIEGVTILSLGSLYLALLTATWKYQPRITWLVPPLWLGLAYSRIRHGPLFAVVAAAGIADMLPHCTFLAPLRLHKPSRSAVPLSPSHQLSAVADAVRPVLFRRRAVLVPVALVTASLLLQAVHLPLPILGAGWSRLSPDRWPVEAVDVLRQRAAGDVAPVKVFNDLGLGGYLIYAAPETRVYIDDRCELYGDEGLLQYERFTREPASLDAFAACENVPYALTKCGTRFDKHFRASPAWRLLHRDATAALYERRPQLARGQSECSYR